MPKTALAAVLAALTLTGSAQAAPPTGPPSDVRVDVSVSLQDANGRALRTFDCAYTGAPADDRPDCLAVVGDPQDEIALIERAGADRSVVTLRTSDGLERRAGISRRADGTWLSRGSGTLPSGTAFSYGFVCDRGGDACVPWRATTATAARAAVRKADAELRRIVRRRG